MAYTEGYCPKCGQTGDLCNHNMTKGVDIHLYSVDLEKFCTSEQIAYIYNIVTIIERGKRLCKKGVI